MNRVALLIATVGGLGRVPVAPGTAGSAAGLGLVGALRWLEAGPSVEAALMAVAAVLGVWAGGAAERHYGVVDPKPVVIDEVLGMLVTVAWVPLAPGGAVAAFVLFRIADVVKPFPAGRFERLPGGWGIMADDAVAALYAHVALRAAVVVAPGWLT